MAVKIRLQRKGRTKAPFYHIVIADARSPRDGKFIQKIGTYNPMTTPATINIDRDAAFDWLMKGAQPTDTIRAILRFKGVLHRKHLMRGVAKGAMSLEDAEKSYLEWIADKDAKIATRVEKTKEAIAKKHEILSGTAKPKKVVEEVAREAPKAVTEDKVENEAPVVEEVANNETANEEVVNVAEETPEAVAEAPEAAEESPEEAVAESTDTNEELAAPAEEAAPETEKAEDTTTEEA